MMSVTPISEEMTMCILEFLANVWNALVTIVVWPLGALAALYDYCRGRQ